MNELKELMRVLFAIFRYPAAIVIAFVASIATLCYSPEFSQPWAPNDDSTFWGFIWFFKYLFSTGMVGVAAGGLCLPRNQRWIGSLCLLFLGLGFTLWVSLLDPGTFNFFLLVPIAAGGIIPVVIHYLLRPKSAQTSSIDAPV